MRTRPADRAPDPASGPGIDAFIFDTDGVIARTATVHAAAWKALFDELLDARPPSAGEDRRPFTDDDYRRYVDGKGRYDGVASFLASRGIMLPFGSADDPEDRPTVCGLGNRKNRYFHDAIRAHGVQPFESTIAFVRDLRGRSIRTAAVSASENAAAVIAAAGAASLFDVRVDGVDVARLHLPGKPDPALFVEAAARLRVPPARAAVVEDALAGVEAGRRGGFGLVIGVDRTGHADDLLAHGADVTVTDLAELDANDLPARPIRP